MLPRLLMVLLVLLVSCSTVWATERLQGQGELIVISPFSPTIAVDLTDATNGSIIAGKLAADAVITLGEEPVSIDALQVGDQVTIIWQTSDESTEIHAIMAAFRDREDGGKTAVPVALPPKEMVGEKIGLARQYTIRAEDTMLDIARDHGLGYNEIMAAYPDLDPWIPPADKILDLPTEWLLPDVRRSGIVLNVAEMRLYHFTGKDGARSVATFPVGIGDPEYQTPTGSYTIGSKRKNPTWYIPPSLREKYKRATMPPGPDNPLGDYWLGLKNTMYGIHGTDMPWSIGRQVSRGCIRMYPEDIERFFPDIKYGTKVTIVYQPVKVAHLNGRTYIEVHPDGYGKIESLTGHANELLAAAGLTEYIDQNLLQTALMEQRGMVIDISATPSPALAAVETPATR